MFRQNCESTNQRFFTDKRLYMYTQHNGKTVDLELAKIFKRIELETKCDATIARFCISKRAVFAGFLLLYIKLFGHCPDAP